MEAVPCQGRAAQEGPQEGPQVLDGPRVCCLADSHVQDAHSEGHSTEEQCQTPTEVCQLCLLAWQQVAYCWTVDACECDQQFFLGLMLT